MKKLITVFLLLFSVCAHAQQMTREEMKEMLFTKPTIEQIRKTRPKACYFYNSAEDYNNNKPVPNVEWVPYSYTMVLGSKKIEVIKNGAKEKIKIFETGYDWISNEDGMLMRMYDKEPYTLVVNGPICYYVQWQFGEASILSDGSYSFALSMDKKFFDFYSLTLTGDLQKMDEKVLDEYLERFNLKEQYKNDKIKREMKDSVNDYHEKKIRKLVKYINLVNEKLTKG